MKDRVPVNPGRVLITPENGSSAYYATMTRADNPTQEGTPLNKNSLLKDSTAALFGLGVDAVPDDVLNAIKTLIDTANANANTKAKIATGSYTGSGATSKSLTFDFVPKLVVVRVGTSGYNSSGVALVLVYQNSDASYWYGTGSSRKVSVTWNGKTVTWSCSDGAHWAFNDSSLSYKYVAIG